EAPMEWEVSEDRNPQAADAAPSWATRLKLQLPSLGEVEARISLAGDQLVLRLVSPDSASVLQEHAPALREKLLASGLTLTDLSVLAQASTEVDLEANAVAAAETGAPDADTGSGTLA